MTPPFLLPSRSISANLIYEARTQVNIHLAFYIFDNTHAPTNASPPLCYAKPFGTDPASRYYFLLFFPSILVLSFCYNGIFLMGGISISPHCSSELLSFCGCCSHLIMPPWRSPHDSPISLSLSGLITAERLQCKR